MVSCRLGGMVGRRSAPPGSPPGRSRPFRTAGPLRFFSYGRRNDPPRCSHADSLDRHPPRQRDLVYLPHLSPPFRAVGRRPRRPLDSSSSVDETLFCASPPLLRGNRGFTSLPHLDSQSRHRRNKARYLNCWFTSLLAAAT